MSLRLLKLLSHAERATRSRSCVRHLLQQRRALSAGSRPCPKCSSPLPTALPVCPACHFVGPLPSHLSPHDILPSHQSAAEANPFRVDPKVLRASFLRAQQVCHPDAWSGAPPPAQALAGDYSALVNEAYQVLSSPRRRAESILARHGRETEEHEQVDDPELFMKVMDARERIEDGDDSAKEEVLHQNKEEMDASVARLEELIGAERWDAAKSETTRLKYLETIDAAARGIEHH